MCVHMPKCIPIVVFAISEIIKSISLQRNCEWRGTGKQVEQEVYETKEVQINHLPLENGSSTSEH